MTLQRATSLVFFLGATLVVSGCSATTPSKPNAQQEAVKRAEERENYVPKNDVEGENYNARQRLSDNPSTLVWCSAYPANPNVKPFTVPIVGKLTSGNKRPYPTSQGFHGGSDGVASGNDYFTPELPGPDGFFGSSGEYRYGFDPAGNYHDFYNMETYCTSVPTVIQKNTTEIAISVSGDLNKLDEAAQIALESCREKDPDPSVSCDEAAVLLGVK